MDTKALLNSLKSLAAAFLLAALLVFSFNFIALRGDDPSKNLSLFAYAALFLSAFAGGILTSRLNKENGLICGAVTGLMYSAVICVVSLCLCRDGSFSLVKILLISIALIAVSAIGGLIALPREKSLRQRRKEIMRGAGR